MKKCLAMLLILLVLCAPLVNAEQQTAGNRMGYELLSQLYVPGRNCVISPVSARYALGMAASGASGETLEEMCAVLGVSDPSDCAAAVSSTVKCANAAFVGEDIKLDAAYASQIAQAYAAELFAMDDAAVEKINAWVKLHTDGLIEELLRELPQESSSLVLVNAVAMDAKWALPFDANATGTAPFHAADGDIEAQMMFESKHLDYAQTDELQCVRLPYAGDELEMWILLPREGAQVRSVLELLCMDGLSGLRSAAERKKVDLSLPKLDVTDENELADALQAQGMRLAFTAQADYSRMADVPLHIGSVLQKARIQIDEDRTRAAAASAVINFTSVGTPEKAVEVCVDRPFVFVIEDCATLSVCFAGIIEKP